MNFLQKILTTCAVKKAVLLFAAGLFTVASMAQDLGKFFSGEWKLNESKSNSIQKFPLCIFGGGDRMRSKTMKIIAHPGFLAVDVASESADGSLVTRQEKLIFNYKEGDTTFVGRPREQSVAYWSAAGCITINSIRSFDKNGRTADVKVTEVWQLANGAKSISIQVYAVSGPRTNTMNLVYDKQMAVDYRF